MSKPVDLKEIELALAEATPGPWWEQGGPVWTDLVRAQTRKEEWRP